MHIWQTEEDNTGKMKIKILCLCALVLFQCTKKNTSPEMPNVGFFETFNHRAKIEALKKFDTYDLYPMTALDKCILKQGILKYLDEMNNSKLVQLDSFHIRNYHFDDLGSSFSVVAIDNRFHFLYLPRLYEYWYTDKYYVLRDTIHELRNPDFAIARINSGTLDNFLEEEVFVSRGTGLAFHRAVQLMEEIFPDLTRHPVTIDELTDWVKRQPVFNRETIDNILVPITKRKPRLTNDGDFAIYKLEYVGYLFFDFRLDDEVSLNLQMDIYFVPYNQRYGMGYERDQEKFAGCYPTN